MILKRFDTPDETRVLVKGKFEIVRLGGMTIGRATYEPGWKWSEHVGPIVGAARCTVEHVGMVLAGIATAAFDDGRVIELRAGGLFYIPPVPHDSWVVGDEPYVSLHFLGAEKYARKRESAVSTQVLECLRNDPEIADLFWELCDFGAIEENPPDWFALESGEPVKVVGRDACGGRFCLLPSADNAPRRVLYVDSEGQAGVIGESLADAIGMMIGLPYWSDCLKFSGGGKVHEMKKAHASLEKDLHERHPDVESSRGRLYRAFGLSAMESPLEVLHRVVTEGASTRVIGTADGWVLDGLFGRFVVEDKPKGLQ